MGAQWKAKHKEAAANAKGRTFGKLSKEIMIAARSGADPDMNPRLRLVVEQAKKASMPREQRHVSGRDLIYGISEYALNQFGPLTRTVRDAALLLQAMYYVAGMLIVRRDMG